MQLAIVSLIAPKSYNITFPSSDFHRQYKHVKSEGMVQPRFINKYGKMEEDLATPIDLELLKLQHPVEVERLASYIDRALDEGKLELEDVTKDLAGPLRKSLVSIAFVLLHKRTIVQRE